MASLSGNRPTSQYSPQPVPTRGPGIPIADNVHIFQGALMQKDGNGRAVPAGLAAQADTHTFVTIGRAYEEYDNTVAGHVAGALTVEPEFGAFCWDNSATDPVAQADVYNTVYAQDDHTIAKTGGAGPVYASAGKLLGLINLQEFGTQAVVLTMPGIV